MSVTTIILLVVLISLILISGFFAAAEIGMMSINRYRLRYLVKKKDKKAIRVHTLLAHPDKLLSIILIGNTLANITASTVATILGQSMYGSAGIAIATIIVSLIILIFAEMMPKTLAALRPQQIAFWAALPLQILHLVLSPIVYVASFITNYLLKLVGVSMDKIQRETLSTDELRLVVHETGGLLPIEHKSMLLGLLDLEKATVEDILIPPAEIIGIDIERHWPDILAQLETAQHTRLPLYRHRIDNLLGIIHIRQVLNLNLRGELTKEHLIALAEAPYFVPEATALNTQLLHFQKMKKRSCFVVDEYGDLQGLITMEDILEEVVGEFTTDITNLSKDI
ncbi:MAG TPA: magnesium/cobalt efflux protein, partial [Legionellales bacterium]|nr:magnesium/cobalt efflux protein [Legionellales bacterium]